MVRPQFAVGDRLQLKKKHPCVCDTCGRDMTLPREKLEKMTKKVNP